VTRGLISHVDANNSDDLPSGAAPSSTDSSREPDGRRFCTNSLPRRQIWKHERRGSPSGVVTTESGSRPAKTAWLRPQTALREFLGTETGSSFVLLGAALAALVWANTSSASYGSVWHAQLSVTLAGHSISMDLRSWVNSGLMTFFFFVVGLEARREFDIGEFRDRPRIVLPVLAGIGGMLGAIGIYLAFNAGQPSVHGWGAAMSTDTAFSLGILAVLGNKAPARLRGFILTVTVVDDIVGLVVIATVYSHHVALTPLVVAIASLGLAVVAVRLRLGRGLIYFALALVGWVALVKSGIDPLVIGLGFGLLAYAAPANRADLERASNLFREFREQPSPGLAVRAGAELRTVVSPNARLALLYHPWTSYVIVPLFGLANAGIPIDVGFLSRAYRSPITLGIVLGYVLGKPAGVTAVSALATKLTRGRLRPPVGWAAVVGAGSTAGIGFTVSLLVSSIAFKGTALEEATLGVVTAAIVASVLGSGIFVLVSHLPLSLRARALLGRSDVIVDLADPVDGERDHIRGPMGAPVTLVEYGDFECPYCGQAEPVVRELLAEHGDLRYVWRHLPLTDVHPHAQLAAEAAEAAGAQGRFWEMHDQFLGHQGKLELGDVIGYAADLGLDGDRLRREVEAGAWREHVALDVESADLSGAAGTPTFFVNGQRLRDPYDIGSLAQAVKTAFARADLAQNQQTKRNVGRSTALQPDEPESSV
jgi:Na+/H+ antiporter NhaA